MKYLSIYVVVRSVHSKSGLISASVDLLTEEDFSDHCMQRGHKVSLAVSMMQPYTHFIPDCLVPFLRPLFPGDN